MNKLGSITLLGVFAAAGVALAIGVGMTVGSTSSPRPAGLGFRRTPAPVSAASEIPDGSSTPASPPAETTSLAVPYEPPTAEESENSALESTQAAPDGEHAAAEAAPSLAVDDRSANDRAATPAVVHLGTPAFAAEASWGTTAHTVPPAPPYGQQLSLGALQETIKQAMEELRRNEQPVAQAAEAASRDTAPLPPAAEPRPAAGGAAPAGNARIREEDGGLLTIHVQNEDIRSVLELLGAHGGINILASPRVQGLVSATLGNVSVHDALDAILRSNGYQARNDGNFVFVGTAADFVALEQSFDRIATRIYRPNYITASELQKLLGPLLTDGVGVSSISSPAESGIGADSTAAGGNSFAGAEAVVVRDYEAVLMQIDALVADVDIRPLQVHIEAMILSVTLKEDDQYGVNWEFLRDSGNVKLGLGLPAQTLGPDPTATLTTFDFERGALKIGFLDRNLGAFLSALETIGDTSVIANPRLLVLNKQRANIQIGDQKGYISTTVTETTATETVEFMETGTILRIRPFISTDGMIRMEIHPELSKGEVREKGRFTLPEKQVTEVTSNVMVRDGSTVVIGGLMRDEVAVTKNQLPFLGNLPMVGFAFRSSTETTERQEVMVLITPHIVYEPEMGSEGGLAAAEFHRRHEVMGEKLEPFNRRHVAYRYYRLARNAWAVGDRQTALRFAELAVHFLPAFREAIELRSDIWLGRPHGDYPVMDLPPEIIHTHPLDGPEIADWLLDELHQEPEPVPAPMPEPLHPRDRGTPGYNKDISVPRKLP